MLYKVPLKLMLFVLTRPCLLQMDVFVLVLLPHPASHTSNAKLFTSGGSFVSFCHLFLHLSTETAGSCPQMRDFKTPYVPRDNKQQ